jgi:hypothetical protein
MLRNLKAMQDYAIGATDGTIGHVTDFYFDDKAWVIRYLVVDAGSWSTSRKVLISPIAIGEPNRADKLLPVSTTKEQVKNSPDIDTDKPVSRQHEVQYLSYYGYPYYWGGGGLWGEGLYPNMLLPGYGGFGSPSAERVEAEYASARAEASHRDDDPHLRSCNAVTGYHIHATDGDIGHVCGLLVDEKIWAIRYMIVNTSNWWLGHELLLAPQWIAEVSWSDSKVSVYLTRQQIKDAPAYDPSAIFDRPREIAIYKHYAHRGYWADELVVEETQSAELIR